MASKHPNDLADEWKASSPVLICQMRATEGPCRTKPAPG
jgi:hypothetical protein